MQSKYIDTDKFGEAVAQIANRNVKTAIKVSAESADNPALTTAGYQAEKRKRRLI